MNEENEEQLHEVLRAQHEIITNTGISTQATRLLLQQVIAMLAADQSEPKAFIKELENDMHGSVDRLDLGDEDDETELHIRAGIREYIDQWLNEIASALPS